MQKKILFFQLILLIRSRLFFQVTSRFFSFLHFLPSLFLISFSSRSTSYEKLSAVIIMTRWQKQIKKLHLISVREKNAVALRHIQNENKLSYRKSKEPHLRSFVWFSLQSKMLQWIQIPLPLMQICAFFFLLLHIHT